MLVGYLHWIVIIDPIYLARLSATIDGAIWGNGHAFAVVDARPNDFYSFEVKFFTNINHAFSQTFNA
jgi:hypothetical protein